MITQYITKTHGWSDIRSMIDYFVINRQVRPKNVIIHRIFLSAKIGSDNVLVIAKLDLETIITESKVPQIIEKSLENL